ncbi:related to Peroxisomal acyl-coenzyme A thioester hydrolase 1 [Saccharomycodes ludwigii]|uniref:Related to Peroxisomal acyl-coenzyme A thioester hydrolase 1 n=1 Tax=Saccharomycodes ludwigii TaxID=36035 RepID=A0A376B827_9ASCO|nr:hypothetical protein SCDLUD_004661 [Saccharomycodes ludwigii]KAH3899228.1 hypothetical protein SCDLUD_004661 [Saccharomycodes ludwigii]SSD60847.1 related to Peroxisomal acyl-coenzyme A thioester hydrolase 1 [Saccharomycodes ludwigii]
MKKLSRFSSLDKILAIKRIDNDSFVSINPIIVPPGAKAGFGGLLLGQSLLSSLYTVPKNFIPASLHSYFLIGCNPNLPVKYQVENLRRGKNFIHTQVNAFQNDKLIFTSTMMLNKIRTESGSLNKVKTLHKVPNINDGSYIPAEKLFEENIDELRLHSERLKSSPDVIDDYGERFQLSALDYKFPSNFFNNSSTIANQDEALDYFVRVKEPINQEYELFAKDGNFPSADISLGTDPRANYIAFAYLSDAYFILTLPYFHKKPLYTHKFNVSLDHSIHFHTGAFNSNDWLNFHVDSPRSLYDRHLMRGEVYDLKGKLVATCVQEGLTTF